MASLSVRNDGKRILIRVDTTGFLVNGVPESPRVYELLLFSEQARAVRDSLDAAIRGADAVGVHPYAERLDASPVVLVVVASTNEGTLNDCLDAWRKQDFGEFGVRVVVDCAEASSWEVVKSFADDRFRFDLGAKLQGLPHIYNQALRDSEYGLFVCLSGADTIVPQNFLGTAVGVLREHPEFGFVVASDASGTTEAGCTLVTTRECVARVGILDPVFGVGVTGALMDWRIRVKATGYKPHRLSNIKIPDNKYSIIEQLPPQYDNLTQLHKKHGTNAYTNEVHTNPLPAWPEP